MGVREDVGGEGRGRVVLHSGLVGWRVLVKRVVSSGGRCLNCLRKCLVSSFLIAEGDPLTWRGERQMVQVEVLGRRVQP